MSRYLTSKTLTVILGVLLVTKFALLPLLDWQESQLADLRGKQHHLSKLSQIVASDSLFSDQLQLLEDRAVEVKGYFYEDTPSTKLIIQKEIEGVFEEYKVQLSGFSWLSDSPGPPRTLRASVRFSGDYSDMLKAMWALSNNPEVVRQVAWRQVFTRPRGVGASIAHNFMTTKGNVTLEFYALSGTDTLAAGES